MSDLELANEYARKWHASEAECAALAVRVAELETALAALLEYEWPSDGPWDPDPVGRARALLTPTSKDPTNE